MTMTRLVCTIAIIVAAIYDLIVIQIGGVDWSISRWFQTVGFAAPFELIVLGYLLGHFYGFMPMVYRLYVVKMPDRTERFIIAGLPPSYKRIRTALKLDVDPIITEINDPIIL